MIPVETDVADGVEKEARLVVSRANMKDAVSEIFMRRNVASLSRAGKDGVDTELDSNEREEISAAMIV